MHSGGKNIDKYLHVDFNIKVKNNTPNPANSITPSILMSISPHDNNCFVVFFCSEGAGFFFQVKNMA